jgi:Ca2+-binding RTX toxin-like protein
MSRVINTTDPSLLEADSGGGFNLVGQTEESNRLNGGPEDDLILTAPPDAGSTAEVRDVIDSWVGDDTIAVYGGDDSVLGASGNDLVFGNRGNDTLVGEEGDDSLFGGQENDDIDGGDGDDVISGDLGDDTASGNTGNDLVFGSQGDDSLDGDDGDDTVHGGQGSDRIDGGSGNDLLFGDRGSDLLTGGQGQDTFAFSGHNNPGNTAEMISGDTITDFMSGEDKIALDRAVFSALGDTLESVDFEKTTQVDGASSAKLIYNEETGELIYNPTSETGDEIAIATLQGSPDLNLGDFEVF